HTRSDRDWSSDVCSSDLPGTCPSDGRVRSNRFVRWSVSLRRRNTMRFHFASAVTVVVAVLALAACSASIAVRSPDTVSSCTTRCTDQGLEFGGLVLADEAPSGTCICKPQQGVHQLAAAVPSPR